MSTLGTENQKPMAWEVKGSREESATIVFKMDMLSNCLLSNYDHTHRPGKFLVLDREALFVVVNDKSAQSAENADCLVLNPEWNTDVTSNAHGT